MADFVAIDVETANHRPMSVCQIGVVRVRNGAVAETWSSLVNPEARFSGMNIGIHGIGPSDVEDSPVFPEIYGVLRGHLRNSVIISHTAFDQGAISGACRRYGLAADFGTWLDSAKVVRRAWPDRFARRGYGLKDVAQALDISFRHHDAIEDARAAAEIMIRVLEESERGLDWWLERVTYGISPGQPGQRSRRAVPALRTVPAPRALQRAMREAGSGSAPEGEVAVFTGTLTLPRRQIAAIARQAGCRVSGSVTGETTILVVGARRGEGRRGEMPGRKHGAALARNEAGQGIAILSEPEFLRMIGVDDLDAEGGE